MDRQLQAIVDDLDRAWHGVRALRAETPHGAWERRPAPGCWSPAECIEHLNLISEALLPLFRAALQEARDSESGTPSRYRRDLMGWAIWTITSPSRGWKTQTKEAFVPDGAKPVDAVIAEFAGLQAKMVACVRDADGLPIDRVRVVSPFDARVKSNLYSMFTLVPRHQRRHLLQAGRAARAFEAAPASALAV